MKGRMSLFAAAVVAAPALAEPHRVIVRDDDQVMPGVFVTAIPATATNNVGGFGVAVTATGTTSHIFTTPMAGLATPAAPTLVRSEGVLGPYNITAFEGEIGLSDAGSVAYGVTHDGGLDSVFLDNNPLAIGDSSSDPTFPGQFWAFGSRIRMTPSGVAYWKAGVSNTAGGSTVNRGLVRANPVTKVFAGGDMLPNMPNVLDSTPSATLFRYRYSANATNYISQDLLDGATTTTDNVMILNGAGLLIDGQLAREGSLVPTAAGGDGTETWGNFQEQFVNEAGLYYVLGDTSAATTQDHYVLANGVIRIREGQTIDGAVLNGSIDEAWMNESGDLAVTWVIDGGIEVLMLNRRIILREGDLVDLDRNGTPMPNYVLSNFGATSGVAVTNRIGGLVRVYVIADVDTAGTTSTTDDVDTLIEVSVCLPDINRSGSVTVQDIFDFLAAYFANDLSADFNNSFDISVQDIFDFLSLYFSGCG